MRTSTSAPRISPGAISATLFIIVDLLVCPPADGATIGVLSDGRQVEALSLLEQDSAARVALQADGHELIELPSLSPTVLNQVDVLWLPLLELPQNCFASAGCTYTTQERINIAGFVDLGGSVIWLGDAGLYNLGDDSFLSTFDTPTEEMRKLPGQWSAGLSPAPLHAAHPVVTGPHGHVDIIGSNASYGLFESTPIVTDVFVDDSAGGTLVGLLGPSSGYDGAGRVAFICDATMFGQLFLQDDHQSLLRNVAKWAQAAPGYTPSGDDVDTGAMSSSCAACAAVQVVFGAVTATGETTVQPIGAGRCGFEGIPHGALPDDFLGYGFAIQTSATIPDPTNLDIVVTYDENSLTSLGIAEASLQLYWYEPASRTTLEVTTSLDTTDNKVTGHTTGPGLFLLGAMVTAEDCNSNAVPDECDIAPSDPDGNGLVSEDCDANGIPDECEIDQGSSAPGGPFFCQTDCSPDCNNNGVPDTCDLANAQSQDCNSNGIPDECEIDQSSGAPGGPFFCQTDCSPDCNNNGRPDTCDLADAQSQDCNANGTPDECEIDQGSSAPGGPFFCQIDCSPDCNNNGVPDPCDVANAQSQDCNSNGTPDECEADLGPVITQQPTNHVACEGGAATFAVAATGPGPLTYQWRKNDVDIPGADGETYTIASAYEGDVADYNVVVANACASAGSEHASLTIHQGPTVTLQPADQYVCQEGAALFSVVAAGLGPLSYQWQKDGDPLADGGPISGATTDTLLIDPLEASHDGPYTCVVTDQCASTASEPAGLTVGRYVQLSEHPQDVFACPGDITSFAVAATGAALIYQWQFDHGGGFGDLANGDNISGATLPVLTIGDITDAAAGLYRCIVAGDCGAPATTAAAELTVGDVVQIEDHPTDQSACPGDTVSLGIAAAGTDLTYLWQFDDGGGFAILDDGGGISGSDTDTLTITDVISANQGLYYCTVFAGCGGPLAGQAAVLDVGQPPSILAEPDNQQACPGDDVLFYVAALGTGLTYQWQHDDGNGFQDLGDGPDIGGTASSTLLLANITPQAGGQYRCGVSADCGTPIATVAAALTVGTPAAIIAQPTGQSVCPGDQVGLTITATGSELAYQWQFNDGAAFENLADGDAISGATTEALTISAATPEHQGLYRCVVFAGCGPALTGAAAELEVTGGACDCNGNGQPDAEDIASGFSQDCNNNGVPDTCDLADGTSADCNDNGIPDDCDIADGTNQDCNNNGVPDLCDLSAGASQDCNADGLPDDCQLDDNDCNSNGVPDECDPPYGADAGEAFTLCSGRASLSLGGAPVAVGSTPPYTFFWQVISGPDGGGTILAPTDEHPRFVATVEGVYELEVVVSDASQQPCLARDTVEVIVTTMSADAGESLAMCAGSTSAALSPTVSGGVEPYAYVWAIDPGAPSTSPDQFTGDGQHSAAPTFTPDSPGQYTLSLTVLDANDLNCIVTDTLTVEVMQLEIELGDDFARCLGGESGALGLAVTSQGTEPLTYGWSIEDGSPDTDPTQFTGSGPGSANPTFSPNSLGDYLLRATVRDSSTPPCEQIATIRVTAGSLTVEAGIEHEVCVGAEGIRLEPTAEGGAGELFYAWSIEPGSPSLEQSQFTDPHDSAASPLFVPFVFGTYVLRLTVIDSGTPPCSAADTVVVHATAMTVDAGADFITQAFSTTAPLGALAVAQGGDGPFAYHWEIFVGPSRDAGQLSATDTEHPLFTPAAVGTYSLQVTVTDSNGAGCSVSDRLAIEAIASRLTLPVNAEGRLFMPLRIDAPHTRGEVRIIYGRPGVQVVGELLDDGPTANSTGLLPDPGLTRRLVITSQLEPGSYVAVVMLYYDEAEIAGVDERALRLHGFAGQPGFWYPLGTAELEEGPFPTSPNFRDLGRHGVDPAQGHVWAVVDYLGEFRVGIPSGEVPTAAETPDPGPGYPAYGDSPDDPDGRGLAPLCGAPTPLGALAMLPLMLGGAARMVRPRRR